MIKIKTTNGFEIEVNDVNEARAIIGVDGVKIKKTYTNKIKTYSEEIKRNKNGKIRKNAKGPGWTLAEVKFIIDNVEKGSAFLKEAPELKAHTTSGVQQMFWKVRKNPPAYKVNPGIQALIDEYHRNKA